MSLARKKQAISQANGLAKVERQIAKAMLKQLGKIKNLALQYEGNFNLRSTDIKALEDSILTAQITAHLISKRNVRKQVPRKYKKVLQLDVVSEVIELFKSATEEEVQQLIAQYAPATQKVMVNLTSKLTTELREALADAVESNVTPRVAIISFFQSNGLDSLKPHYVETLLRTQTQLAYGAAAWQEYNSPVIDEILWGYEYSTVGDDRVRENHAALDGVVLPKDDPFWRNFFPPNGYNCRCQAIPIFEPERIKRQPKDAETDEGFDFNPTILVNR
jgi:SPP1 gp7 family putative phage head morphogenesis protein